MKRRIIFFKLMAAASVVFALLAGGFSYYTYNQTDDLAAINSEQFNSSDIKSNAASDEATNADVNSYINSGVGVVNYRGHGNDYYWGGEDFMGNPSPWNINNEIYTTEEARDLTNGNKTPIVFSIACLNANLEYSYECLAEAFTKADYGATAILEQPDLHLQ